MHGHAAGRKEKLDRVLTSAHHPRHARRHAVGGFFAHQAVVVLDLLLPGLVVPEVLSLEGRALARRPSNVPVLIDAPGTDPFDPTQREEIAALAATVQAVVALVLPAGMDPAEAADIAHAFAEAGASLLIVTRMDITRRLGAVLAAGSIGRLALAEAGIGPGAADGMVALTPALLSARLIQTTPPSPERLQ